MIYTHTVRSRTLKRFKDRHKDILTLPVEVKECVNYSLKNDKKEAITGELCRF